MCLSKFLEYWTETMASLGTVHFSSHFPYNLYLLHLYVDLYFLYIKTGFIPHTFSIQLNRWVLTHVLSLLQSIRWKYFHSINLLMSFSHIYFPTDSNQVSNFQRNQYQYKFQEIFTHAWEHLHKEMCTQWVIFRWFRLLSYIEWGSPRGGENHM